MPLYDLMLLLDPGAPSDRHDAILKEVTGLLEGGGKIVTTQEWGTRRMTFEIDHRPEADYHLLQFETEPGGALLDQVDHSLKIMDGVLRHRIIKQKDGNVPPPAPRAEGRYAEAPPVEGAPAADDAAIATSAGEAVGDAAAATPAGEPAAATAAGEAAGPEADVAAPSDSAPPTADPAADPVAGDAAPAADATPADEAAPAAEAAPVETAAPDASSLPPEEAAGDDDAPAGPAAA
jgi:small subunit ribosomal protein S6